MRSLFVLALSKTFSTYGPAALTANGDLCPNVQNNIKQSKLYTIQTS